VIGDVKFLQVFLIGGKYTFKREWFLNNIVLMDLTTRKLFEVPVYRWINDKITIPTGEGKSLQFSLIHYYSFPLHTSYSFP
jgi:hypothetical protein